MTKILRDQQTGQELAAVYVPTAPNPTSDYIEIVSPDKVNSTNWTIDEAMSFIFSGEAPDAIPYSGNMMEGKFSSRPGSATWGKEN